MRTFFGRKYMRGRPRPVEQIVGAFLLGLTAFIVVSFFLTGGLFKDSVEASSSLSGIKDLYGISEKPLFLADEANLTPPAPSHELKTARAMLPVVAEELKRADIQAFAIRPGEDVSLPVSEKNALAALTKVAQAYDARWLYAARYDVTGSDQNEPSADERARVFVFDMGDPAGAFGIWRVRRPAGAQMVSLGRDGWKATRAQEGIEAAAFWSGRYYTEVWRTGASDRETVETKSGTPIHVVNTLSAAAARLQLTYGGPFWADRVLPDQDRVADSFRYVRTNALGLEELSECWLADYEGDVTLAVMQPNGTQRDKLLSALRERFQHAEGAEGEEPGSEEHVAAESAESAESAAYSASEESYGESEAGAYGAEEGYASEEGESSESAYGASEEGRTGGGDALRAMRSWAASVETEAAAGVVDDRVLVAYTTPDYVFIVLGEDVTRMTALAQAAYDRWGMPRLDTGQSVAQASDQNTQAAQARFAEVPGGRILAPSNIERYTDNVYEKINGKEGAFRAFHFQELRFGRYAVTGTQDAYDVYIYDMAEPVNAFGMYMSERSYSAEPVELGRAGYLSGSSAFFWKSRYYVNVLGPPEESEDKAQTALTIARAIEETIADDGRPFWAEDMLPEAHRVPHSLAYQATSALTFEFLEGIFIAKYKNDEGVEYQMFIGRYESPQRASDMFDQYATAVAEYDTVVSKDSGEGFSQIVTESAGFYTTAFVVDEYFAGVTETDDKDIVIRQSEAFRRQVAERDAGS